MAAVTLKGVIDLALEKEKLLADAKVLAPQLQMALAGQGYMVGANPALAYVQAAQKGGGKGGGGSSGIVAGAVGGATAAAIFMLVDTIKDLAKQSKIVAMTQDAVAKATGLLIDMVLIPFLPLITYGIINLFHAITKFGAEWKKDWKGEAAELVIDGMLRALLPILTLAELFFGFDLTDYFHDILDASDGLNILIEAWNNFWADPLGAIKFAWSEFTTWVSNGLRDTWAGINNFLLGLPIIGDAMKLLGGKHMAMTIPEVTDDEYKAMYAERNKTQTPQVSVEDNGGAHPGVKITVLVQGDDGKFIEDTVERKFNSMNWAEKAPNWGTN